MSWDEAVDGVDRDTPGGRPPRAWEVAQRLGLRAANDDVAHPAGADDGLPAYAELHCVSDFSFLRGASDAEALFERAQRCGYSALAITDECSLAGIVRALEASEATGVPLVVGSEFVLVDGLKCVLLVENHAGYTRLCELITVARRSVEKKGYRLARADVERVIAAGAQGDWAGEAGVEPGLPGSAHCGLFALWIPGAEPDPAQGRWLQQVFGDRAFLGVELHRETDDAARLSRLLALAAELRLPALACGDVHMAQRRERVLQDTLTAIRHTTTLAEAGALLFRNGERHLRTRRALGNIHPAQLLEAAAALAARCTFSMREVKYRYPKELVPEGETPSSHLRALTEAGMRERWPGGVPEKARAQIEEELALIAELEYEAFFLTVHDIVRFAREKQILCQGRGSSANSAVCYALGITAVNPAETRLLIARFLSRARKEPPDIDVDFEHERREEVMQYVYGKYGRQRAALAATVISYRGKSAVRDVAKAFGLPQDQIGLLAECFGWGNGETPMEQRLREAGFDPGNPMVRKVLALAGMIEGRPRHLSQHVGGFVISDTPLSALVPVENAAMVDRTIIQWDKDDLETLKLLKVDCLALGMLTCIRKAFDLVERHRGLALDMATVPGDDVPTYEMMQAADTVGVFQIESRAQMSMLPRLRPAKFYDIVVQVAIVRPGPIQGGMVHPYLRRRMGKEDVTYPSEGVKAILGDTLGIPLFQEQVMELVMHAGYDADQADGLRRSMAAWKRGGDMEPHRIRIRELMEGKGYASDFIDQIFEQIKGFGSYGFPQSHAASFAKLVYISCWLKRHEPAAFACALLNAQPMGFYSASQIVQDARRGRGDRRGIEVRPVDVVHSDWHNTLEGGHVRAGADDGGQPALRLGLRQVAGMSERVADAITAARAQRPFADIRDLCLRAGLDAKARNALAEAGALDALAGHRNAARWAVAGVEQHRPLLPGSPEEARIELPAPRLGEELAADYRSTGLSLRTHPMALLRAQMVQRRILGSRELRGRPHGSGVHVAGLVTQRQRPATAKGTIFVTLEDEHGMVNVIVWPHLAIRQRKPLLQSRLLAVRGRWERVDGVEHLVAGQMEDLSGLLGGLPVDSRDFH
ncbi:error-prone DNA polymerase [Pseudoxanthomonas daejeonensis]|uniref:Error-prone DNA polymerase n=1 Tax=Pseudoxanthomonas daejeonensis TaxID=266062 RepID=A0ABQ6Z4S2_9GAMM|nr:error-prone DNA polymerase [Pseudoxanthomonas daejeonensis]KAF1692855.1 error-prone DNA polymerase [Pseudoxanthomonas daejeonensis]UNK57879.1 error-prone DNA polymerase [Pseudoxanthomonas daejeonensis]